MGVVLARILEGCDHCGGDDVFVLGELLHPRGVGWVVRGGVWAAALAYYGIVLLHLLLVVAVVFGVNLLPAFGPPTWALLVFFRFRYPDIPAPALIVAGAVAATSGRLLLALAFPAFATKPPANRPAVLQVLGHTIG